MFELVFNVDDGLHLMLTAVRVSTIVFVVPVFGANHFPTPWKIAFSLILAFTMSAVFPRTPGAALDLSAIGIAAAAVREAAIGLLVGVTSGLIFHATLLGGQVIGTQMGLGIASVLDPHHGTDMSIIAQFHFLFALVLFFAVDGHHMLLGGVAGIFEFLPVGGTEFPVAGLREAVGLGSAVFAAAVQIAASVIVLLLMTSASLGIIARTVPQINIFIVGFPLKLLVGLFGLGLSIPFVAGAVSGFFERIPDDLSRVFGAI